MLSLRTFCRSEQKIIDAFLTCIKKIYPFGYGGLGFTLRLDLGALNIKTGSFVKHIVNSLQQNRTFKLCVIYDMKYLVVSC